MRGVVRYPGRRTTLGSLEAPVPGCFQTPVRLATIPHSPWNPVGLTNQLTFQTKFERGKYERIPDLSAQGFPIEGRVNQNEQISSKEDEAAQCRQTRH